MSILIAYIIVIIVLLLIIYNFEIMNINIIIISSNEKLIEKYVCKVNELKAM